MGRRPMLALPRAAPYFWGASSPNFAKSNRVVAVSRLEQLYGVTAIKSSCYAGTTRLSSGIHGTRCDDTGIAAHPSLERVRRPTIPVRPRRALRTCRANVNRLRHVQNQPQPLLVHRRGSDPI